MERSHVIWLMSIIYVSIGGTLAIIYIIKHFTDYFEGSEDVADCYNKRDLYKSALKEQ